MTERNVFKPCSLQKWIAANLGRSRNCLDSVAAIIAFADPIWNIRGEEAENGKSVEMWTVQGSAATFTLLSGEAKPVGVEQLLIGNFLARCAKRKSTFHPWQK